MNTRTYTLEDEYRPRWECETRCPSCPNSVDWHKSGSTRNRGSCHTKLYCNKSWVFVMSNKMTVLVTRHVDATKHKIHCGLWESYRCLRLVGTNLLYVFKWVPPLPHTNRRGNSITLDD